MAATKNFGVVRNQQAVPITGFDGEGHQVTIGPHDRLVLPHDRAEILFSLYSVATGTRNVGKIAIEPENDRNSLAEKFLGNDQSQQNEF